MKRLISSLVLVATVLVATVFGANANELPEPEALKREHLAQQVRTVLAPPIEYELRAIQLWLERALAHAKQQQWDDSESQIAALLASLSADFRHDDRAEALLAQYPLTGRAEVDLWLLDAKLNLASGNFDLHEMNATIAQANSLSERLDGWQLGKLTFSLGRAYYQTKQYERSLQSMKTAQRLLADDNASDYLLQVDNIVANIYYRLNDWAKAERSYLGLLEFSRQQQQPYNEANALYVLGRVSVNQQQLAKAKDYFERTVELATKASVNDVYPLAQTQLAQLELDDGNYAAAAQRLQQLTLQWLPEHGQPASTTTLLLQLKLFIQLERYVDAETLLEQLSNRLRGKRLSQAHVTLAELSFHLAQANGDLPLAYHRLVDFIDHQLELLEQQRGESTEWLAVQLEAEELRQARQQMELRGKQQQAERDIAEEATLLLQVTWSLLSLITLGAMLLWWRTNVQKHRMRKLAFEDYLTGAPNRRAILKQAKKMLVESGGSDPSLLIASIDLDHFKKLNDTYGHEVGDRLLQAFARVCEQQLRQDDHFGRIGGEEWLLLLPNTTFDKIDEIFFRLQQAWRAVTVEGFDGNVPLTFSMGVAQVSEQQLNQVMHRADKRLYQAKQMGRDRVVY